MKVILISGKAESGKDTTCNILLDFFKLRNIRAIRMAYGDYVKETARMLTSWDGQKDEKGRALLQWWGTDYVRKIDDRFWLDTVLRLAKIADGIVDYLIIPDVRFPNEITAWTDKGFDTLSVRVERPNHKSALTEKQLNHISETALDNWSFDVKISATTIEELEHEVYCQILADKLDLALSWQKLN